MAYYRFCLGQNILPIYKTLLDPSKGYACIHFVLVYTCKDTNTINKINE